MAPCLCAPTTHEGSFRCRLHRGLPALSISPAHENLANLQKGASVTSSCESICVDKPNICLVRVRESPSAATPLHQVSFDLHKTSSCRSSSASSASLFATPSYSRPPPPPLSSSTFRHRTCPPPASKATSPSASPSRSLYRGSSSNSSTTSRLTSSNRCTTSPSTSHAAALAILKHHLHNKHGRSQLMRSNTVVRSSTGYKIGPSRLSQVGRACTDEVLVLKKEDCSTANFPAHNAFPPKKSSFSSGKPQAKQSTSMESSQIGLKFHSIVSKFKQSESSCKIMGYKAGPFIVPTVY